MILPAEISSNFSDLLEFYRNNPLVALFELLNVELAVPQQLIFLDMWNNKFVIITAGRGTGKTFLLAAYSSLRGLLYPGTRIGLLAPSFRQAKLTFSEVRKMWYAAPIFREATVGKPTFQSDRCVLEFRAVGTTPNSLIEADPLGTGEKIRGARFHNILVDEFAQVPTEIFDAVIKPMAATSSSPMERVKELEKLKVLRQAGVSEEFLVPFSTSNKIIVSSSAFYKFNHMYRRIVEYEDIIRKGMEGYSTVYMNYLDMPDGFMNEDIIEEAKATMPASLFRMEYLGIWESDSDGVFKASLIDSRTLPAGDTVRLKADPEKEYVIACDPARTSDFFSIVVIELGLKNKVVNAMQFLQMKFPVMAETLMRLCSTYNVVRLVMDSQGGGYAVKDLLAETQRFGNSIIIDIDDEEYFGVEGNRILQLVKPSPTVNAESNWAALNLFEQERLWLPGPPTSGRDDEEEAYEAVRILVSQLLNIVATQTRSGQVHFDVPAGGGHGAQKKDLYSALIYGAKKVYDLERENEEEGSVLWGSGVVFSRENRGESYGPPPVLLSSSALLEKKVK